MKNMGIYKILNTKNDQIYIGSSKNIRNRKNRHFNDLKNGVHRSIFLQRSYNKYGKDVFVFELIEYVMDENMLLKREQYWMDILKPKYNTEKVAGSSLGVKHRADVVMKNKERNSNFGNGNAKISKEQYLEILILKEKISYTQIAEIYNVNRTTIERVLRRNGVAPKLPKEKIYSEVSRRVLSESMKRINKNKRDAAMLVFGRTN